MCSVILTCSVSNVCWTEDVSVIVRWKYVLFCSMFGKDSPWTVHGLLVDQLLVDQQLVDQLLSMDRPWLAVFGVRCSMFGCSVFDVMFGEKYDLFCSCSAMMCSVFDRRSTRTFVSVRQTMFGINPGF